MPATILKAIRLNPRSAKRLAFWGILFFICAGFQSLPQSKFPKPTAVKNLLFYVQRSLNTNTIAYQLNLNEKDELNASEPMNIFWINYAKKNGETEPLNYIQRKFAYGIDVKVMDVVKKTMCINFVSYKKKPIYIVKNSGDNTYHAFCTINNKLQILKRVFIQIDGGSFWTPKISYIDVVGTDPVKNEEVTERVIP